MTKMIHLAAQYLATAGISFLDKKDDDSHSNLGFDAENGYLVTWPLNENGWKIALDYSQFSLHWITNKVDRKTLILDGKIHGEIVEWLKEVTMALGGEKTYSYKLHYDLPYSKMTDDFVFSKPTQGELNKILGYRRIAQHALENIVDSMNLSTTIRVWPHHFDTGGYASLSEGSDIEVGFGLAIPDTMCSEHYLYISGYKMHEALDTSDFSKLSKGEWKNDGFKGAILPTPNIEVSEAVLFFKEAIANYKRLF